MTAVSSLGSSLSPSSLAGLLPRQSTACGPSKSMPGAIGNADQISLSAGGINLSRQENALLDPVHDLQSSSASLAQNFLKDFAKQVLGDSADGMQVSFDAVNVSASASMAGMAMHAESGSATRDLAAIALNEAADFVGRGKITTADGHVYSFEVAVHYEARVEAAASSTTVSPRSAVPSGADSAASNKPAMPESEFHFPGKLKDLFELLDQGSLKLPFRLTPEQAGSDGKQDGMLNLRLLDMLEQPNPLLQQLFKAYDNVPGKQELHLQA